MISLLLLWACTADKSPADTGQAQDGGLTDGGGTDTGVTTPAPIDHDEDGWTSDQDCDDVDPAVNPGAVESCNGADDDCDGLLDDADPDVADQDRFYADADGDSFGDPLVAAVACAAPAGFVDNASDCLDSDPLVHPDADEVCDDGLDNDCDGTPNDCLMEGTWDLSELATTVWRADDEDCLAAVARGELSTCGAKGMSMVSSSHGGQDLDGDGEPDLLVRSPLWSVNLVIPLYAESGALEDVASVRLSYAGLSYGSADCEGTTSNCEVFSSSRAVADWDGDGYQDLAISSWTNLYDPEERRTYGQAVAVNLGPFSGEVDVSADASLLIGEEEDHLGIARSNYQTAMTSIEEPDSTADHLIVGAYQCRARALSTSGCVYLIEDPLTSSMNLDRDADTVWYSDDEDQNLGSSIQNLGDTDGDGVAEVVVFPSGRRSDEPSRAWVVNGDDRGFFRINDVAEGVFTFPEAWADGDWHSLPTRTDLTGDGTLDLVIATPKSSLSGVEYSGSVYILPGPFRGAMDVAEVAWARFDGELPYCYFGEHGDIIHATAYSPAMLSIGGIGRVSASTEVCSDPARVAIWYDPKAGVWSEYDADLRINMRIGWEGDPSGRENSLLMSHAWLDGSLTLVFGLENADGDDDPGFIALAPLPGM